MRRKQDDTGKNKLENIDGRKGSEPSPLFLELVLAKIRKIKGGIGELPLATLLETDVYTTANALRQLHDDGKLGKNEHGYFLK